MELTSNINISLNKGIGNIKGENVFRSSQWIIDNEDVSLPAACLILPNVEHNVNWMAQYVRKFNIDLCPHVKTTMCPPLIEMQIKNGAWGVTTATPHQTAVAHHFGVKRILMANQLVGKRNMEVISELLINDPTLEFMCLVDSTEHIEALNAYFEKTNQKIRVLVELGFSNGRTGSRSITQALELIGYLKYKENIVFSGIEFFEGLLPSEDEVRKLCKNVAEILRQLFKTEVFSSSTQRTASQSEFIISGAGSAWFDVVSAELSKLKDEFSSGDRKVRVLLRPGCYITHDAGIYKETEKRIQSACSVARELGVLKPALKILAYVQSRPEPELVIVGMGRRDVAMDSGFPIPNSLLRIKKEGDNNKRTWDNTPPEWKITKLMDQHGFLKVGEKDRVNVGDIIVFDISHPCNTFSAWRYILLTDESYKVLEILPTFF